MTQKQFLENRSNWFESHGPADTMPELDSAELDRYLTKAVLYDALPALAAAGQDVLAELGIKKHSLELHELVGTDGPNGNTGIDGQNMAVALKAVLRGSLLDVVQKKK